MSLTMMIGAGALVLLLAALLVVQRRRAAAQAASDDGDTATAVDAGTADDEDDWRAPGLGDRVLMLVRGRGAAIALFRSGTDEIRLRPDRGSIRLANHHDSVYGGRPDWDHIAELMLAMGKAERCFPGAELSGLLRYVDKAVPVEYSPPLVADLEDGSALDPRENTATG